MKRKKWNIQFIKLSVIIVLIIFLALIIHIIKNCIIIGKLYEKQSELKKVSNYYYISEHYLSNNQNDKNIIEHYYKDGKSRLILNNGKVISWNDKTTKENIIINLDEMKADITNSDYSVGNEFPIYIDKTFKNVKTYIFTKISSDELDGVKCYKIHNKDKILFINKNNGITLKIIDKSNKNKEEIIIYEDCKLNELNDKDVERPNLDMYKINNM